MALANLNNSYVLVSITGDQLQVNHVRQNDEMCMQFFSISYEFQACCLLPQIHCQGFCFVTKHRVQVFWEAELLLRKKVYFLREAEAQFAVMITIPQ